MCVGVPVLAGVSYRLTFHLVYSPTHLGDLLSPGPGGCPPEDWYGLLLEGGSDVMNLTQRIVTPGFCKISYTPNHS